MSWYLHWVTETASQITNRSGTMITPPFPPDGYYLSGAPCQIITREMSDACLMPHQTSVNSHQTSVTQVPHTHQTCTICPPDICQTSTIYLSDIWYVSDVYVVLVWQMYGGSWQMSGGSWQMSGGVSTVYLAGIWQSSEREHQTNSNCLAETVV